MFNFFEKNPPVVVDEESGSVENPASLEYLHAARFSCPMTNWYDLHPEALYCGEALDDAIERICRNNERAPYNTFIPDDLVSSMVKVSEDFPEGAGMVPVPVEILRAIDVDLHCVRGKGFDVFKDPQKLGDMLRKGARGSGPDSFKDTAIAEAVQKTMNAEFIRAIFESENGEEMSPEHKRKRRKSLIYRLRVLIGTALAILSVIITPSEKMEEVLYRENEA